MKKVFYFLLLSFSTLLNSISSYSQATKLNVNIKEMLGQYRSKDGQLLVIQKDNSFYILKGHRKAFDAVILECDTMAKGTWKPITTSALILSNYRFFEKIRYKIVQEHRRSADSVYFKIEIPKDDAFTNGRFKYQISIAGKIDLFESTDPLIAFSKTALYGNGSMYYDLALTIQDLAPLNCKFNGRCYQRLWFNIFEDQMLNTSSNYFTIQLHDLDRCFVERADVQDQLLSFIGQKQVHWQDIDFIKEK